jgi:hypothetical protein
MLGSTSVGGSRGVCLEGSRRTCDVRDSVRLSNVAQVFVQCDPEVPRHEVAIKE